ncbi:MAG TPA: AI-2E family transporter [Terriglobales bacterium]|nr:AI-2E family transporter [Terriglobales bacterium]
MRPENDAEYMQRGLELAIHIGLLILLIGACIVILRPFIHLILWGIIIAIALYPGFKKLQRLFGGRDGLTAVVCTVLMLVVLIVPVVLLTGTVVQGIQTLARHLKEGTLAIPPPPTNIENWFLVGPSLNKMWSAAATNLSAALAPLAPQMKAAVPVLVSTSAGIGLTVLEFALSILVAGVLLANAQSGAATSRSIAERLFGDRAAEFETLAGATIRSVTTGILGVALIQSIFATLGFLIMGLPGAGLWGLIFLFAAVLQVGIVVLIPAAIYAFAIASTSKAVMFLIWCAIVALMDNVLKPLLLGRGVAVPIAVIFLGAIGGFVAMGIIGLFLGAVIVSVGYKLFLAWLHRAGQDKGMQLMRKTI